VCIGVWNVYVESADSRHVYNDNTGDQLIMGEQVLSADCARPAGVVWCTPAAVGERVIKPLGEPGGLGLARGCWCCDWCAAARPGDSRAMLWHLARRAVALNINNSSSSGARMYCTAVS